MNKAIPYQIVLWYGKWAIMRNLNPISLPLPLDSSGANDDKIIEIVDSRLEADRFCQGIQHAMQEMNAL